MIRPHHGGAWFERFCMFSFVRSIVGAAVAAAAADEKFIQDVCIGKHAGPIARAFADVGQTDVPKTRAGCVKWLQTVVDAGDTPGRSDAIRVAYPLFAAACLQALATGADDKLRAFESDYANGIKALKATREAAKAAKGAKGSTPAPTTGTAPAPTTGTAPAPTTGTAPAPTTGTAPAPADVIGDALRTIAEASDAGLLTPEQWLFLDAIMANRPAPAAPAAAPAPAPEPATV